MDDFEMNAQAYKLNRLELTKKAIAFQLEKNRRLRDRNTVILKSGDWELSKTNIVKQKRDKLTHFIKLIYYCNK